MSDNHSQTIIHNSKKEQTVDIKHSGLISL